MTLRRERSTKIELEQSLSERLLAWYTKEKRNLPWRRSGDPYAIWVSEVMLQQTQVKTVIPYYERFLLRFPNVEELGKASLEDVLTIWSGLGYYSRARRMWLGANYIVQQLAGKMPEDYEALLKIPGVGEYTAGAIASIAYGENVTAIDGNVKRVVSRLLAWDEPIETVRSYRHFRNHLVAWQSDLQPGDFNQALMELGAMVCTPKKPTCERCPLAQVCEGYLQGDPLHYPVKKPKAQRQVVTRLTFVLRSRNRNWVYLQKRPSKGLLADLWEFPGVELSQEQLESRNDCIPDISMDKCFDYFQLAVSERLYDDLVKDQFQQGLVLEGPIWYTFSHRRWKIVWVIIDLPWGIESLNLPDLHRAELISNHLLGEASGVYGLDSNVVNQNEKQHWFSRNDLKLIPLPVAFTAIIEELISRV